MKSSEDNNEDQILNNQKDCSVDQTSETSTHSVTKTATSLLKQTDSFHRVLKIGHCKSAASKCSFCPSDKAQKEGDMIYHLLFDQKKRNPYKCILCPFATVKKSHLDIHMSSKHNIYKYI